MTGNVQGHQVDDLFTDKQPGYFKFWRSGDRTDDDPRPDGLNFICPCGCGSVLGVDFSKWQWDGNLEAPTVTPSILHLDGCRWHGFLKHGRFETC